MRISDYQLNKRLRAIEAVSEGNKTRNDDISQINVLDHIAECYFDLDQDIRAGQHEFYNLPGGRGSGKSSFVSLEIVDGIMKNPAANALVCRKYAVTLRGSVFSQIQWAIHTLGVDSYWKATVSPLQFVYETGQVIRLTGLDDPQKLKSLKPNKGYFKYLWMEEFSEINGEAEMRNLQQSVLRGGNSFTVFRSFNPPVSKSNWANTFIEVPDDRAVTLRTNYTQIPVEWLGQAFFDEAARLKEINPLAYDNEYLGIPVGSGGAVFPNIEERTISDEEVRQQEYIFCGIDFGFATDPACVLKVSYNRKKEEILLLDEIYQRGLTNKKLVERIREKGFDRTFKEEVINYGYGIREHYERKQLFTCDSAEPKSIADLQAEGLKATKCHKEPGCVEYRIRWLQARKIVIDGKRTPNARREFVNYEYNQDRSGNFIPSLPDKDNHSIDSLAYALDRQIYTSKNSA